MITRNSPRILLCLIPSLVIGCASEVPQAIDLAVEAQAIRDLDAALSAAAQNRDPVAFGAFFAGSAVQLPPDAPPVNGRAAIQASAAGLLGAGADLRFETVDVKVSVSGDMAISRGRWFLSLETPEGLIQDEGSYVEVWEMVAGQWTITTDIFNSDLPDE